MHKALLLLALAGCATPRAGGGHSSFALPFIEDDYPGALALARSRKLPLFIDAWAPWCHTCRFMHSHVFTDRALSRHAGRFVWLSVDTEKEKNLPFLERFPVDTWPTFLVVDASTEAAAFKWLGTATVPQLERMLEDGERALAGAPAEAADAALARADRLYGERKPAEAALAYAEAIAHGAKGWPKRPRAVESLLLSLYGAEQHEECARSAAKHAPELPRGPSFANAVVWGMSCALLLEAPAPHLAALQPLAREALGLPGLLADDRSGLYELLLEAKGSDPGAKEIAGQWLAFLEAEAEKAANPEARAAFDSHRVSAAIALGEPARAVPALERSERDLPKDYNPPARLALLYRELGRLEEALAACERALSKVYGPRRLRVLETKASVLSKKADSAGARAVLGEAVSFAEGLPAAQRSERTVKRLREELEELSGR
ncbi:MAG: thioredoxin family protein [Myxococcales bacterium]|nr:thioredoxin family protein [Myxococcales bacterium]